MSQQSHDKAQQDQEFNNMEIARQVKSNLPEVYNPYAKHQKWLLARSSNYNALTEKYGTFPKKQGIAMSLSPKSNNSQVNKFSQGPGAVVKIKSFST